MANRQVIYLAGPISGVPLYWKPFDEVSDVLHGLGYAVLVPSSLPDGMTRAQYMRICLAELDSADAVVFLPGWYDSAGARIEHDYCVYTEKPHLTLGEWLRLAPETRTELLCEGVAEVLDR